MNARRASSDWSDHVSKKEAIEVYERTKKKKIDKTLTLIQYFDLEMNEKGYWIYNHVALQVEDVFDVLSIKYPSYDFFHSCLTNPVVMAVCEREH